MVLGSGAAQPAETGIRPDQVEIELGRFRSVLDAAHRELQQLQALEQLAQTTLDCDSAAHVAALITDTLQDSLPEFRDSPISV